MTTEEMNAEELETAGETVHILASDISGLLTISTEGYEILVL